MLKIAIVGCGKIADQHAQAIRRVANCEIVAVCDQEILMAKQLAERFGIEKSYSDIGEMIRLSSPDVVHITTPPQSHFSLAQKCFEMGRHVYLEKPFTVSAPEAESLLALAQSRGLYITASHNEQFKPEMLAMRRLVQKGYLGGKPVHVESHWSYDLGDWGYVGPVLGTPSHWVRQLPGQLLHNIVSHGIARLAEFLSDDVEQITASAQQSAKMNSFGAVGLFDELRVCIRDGDGTTGYFCLSTQIKPGVNQLRVYGRESSLFVDLGSSVLIRHPGVSYKSYLTFVVPPLVNARQNLANAARNIAGFLGRRLYQDAGMKALIERFYTSIRTGAQPPIPYREILLTARMMDEIFSQIYVAKREEEAPAKVESRGKFVEKSTTQV